MNRSILPFVVTLALPVSVALAQLHPADAALERGRTHYDLREWDQAIAEFKEAYRLRPEAPSLFNIAQSYRLKGDCAQAASFYKTYRRNYPEAKNIARVDQFIVEMEACAKQAQPDGTSTGTTGSGGTPDSTGTGTGTSGSTGSTSGTGSSSVGGISATEPRDTPRPGRTLSLTGIAIAGGGAACIIGGVISGLRARSIEQDVQDLPRWDPDLNDKGENADLLAKVLFGVGGAAIVTGGVLFYLGHRENERAAGTAVRVVPRGDGALVVWSGEL